MVCPRTRDAATAQEVGAFAEPSKILVLFRAAALLLGVLCLTALPAQGQADTLRARLQAAFDTYKASPLHYKVFALKQEDRRFDAWYTLGYDDLDPAMAEALAKCSEGRNVVGSCHIYALGDEVVITLDKAALNERIAHYRLLGMRNRLYPQPGRDETVAQGFTGNGRFLAATVAGKGQTQVFLYENDTLAWRHTVLIHGNRALQQGRNFAVNADGTMCASALFVQDSIADAGRSILQIDSFPPAVDKARHIELPDDAFLNDACGLAFSPDSSELAVCLDTEMGSRIDRYELAGGRRLSGIESDPSMGRFDHSLAYDPTGGRLLVRGGSYRFDWVLKKKIKEADFVWLFDLESGEQIRSIKFPAAAGFGPLVGLRFSTDGSHVVAGARGGIVLVPVAADKKVREFALELSPDGQVDMSPHGIVVLADQGRLRRYRVEGGGLQLLDEHDTVSPHKVLLAFDDIRQAWRLADGGGMKTVAALSRADLETLPLVDKARAFFGVGRHDEGLAQLKEIARRNPFLPLDLSGVEFYLKYPDIPLAVWGEFFAWQVRMILEQSPMVSRLGLDLDRDPESGFLFTTLARVAPDSPASRAGLQVGDKVTAINGTSISMANQIQALVGGLPVASLVRVTVERRGQSRTVELQTEKGFREPGKAAQLLLALFDYGQVAAEAGHTGLTRQAAAQLRFVAARYPASFRPELVEKIAASLEALALAHEGKEQDAFALLFAKGHPQPFPFRLFNTRVWWPLYGDRRQLADYLGLPITRLPRPVSSMGGGQWQDYPDLHGVMVPALKIPELVR